MRRHWFTMVFYIFTVIENRVNTRRGLLTSQRGYFSYKFSKTLYNLNGTMGTMLKKKIYLAYFRAAQKDHGMRMGTAAKCQERLLRVMRRDLNCTKEANLLEPYFRVEEFFYNMTGVNEYTDAIMVDQNCDNFSGEGKITCERVLRGEALGMDRTFLISAFDNCYAEQRKKSKTLLSRR